jgi:RNA polymerase sigma-70 factor (ECF subfamily)
MMELQSMLKLHEEDNRRINAILTGDTAAFQALVQDYHPLAYSLAYRVLNHHQDVEEIVQDAFMKIYHALSSFRGEASLKTWILRIVLRLSLNRRRDRGRSSWHRLGLHRSADEDIQEAFAIRSADTATPESQYIKAQTRQRLKGLLDGLPDPLRQVMILNSFEELSYEEIARILDVPIGTVSSRIYSARKKLLEVLDQNPD